jgi:hypothetical protein
MTEEMDAEEQMLNDWEDGTPKSFGNAFTEHWDGAHSQMMTQALFDRWMAELTGTPRRKS